MKNLIPHSIKLSILILFQIATSQAAQYQIVDLGPGTANGINNFGQVVGSDGQAFLWTPSSPNTSTGVKTSLGSLVTDGWSVATAVNDSGVIVGRSNGDWMGEPVDFYAIRWDPVSPNSSVGTLSSMGVPGGVSSAVDVSFATSINSQAQIAGGYYHCAGNGFSFVNQNNVFTQIITTVNGAPQSELVYPASRAFGINANGVVVGDFAEPIPDNDEFPYSHAYIFENGAMTDLGTLLGGVASDQASLAVAVNSNRTVVGYSSSASRFRSACIWTNGTPGSLIDIHTIEDWARSEATAVNAGGIVVGHGFGDQGYSAFIYDAQNWMRDLNALVPSGSGWYLNAAHGVNDLGLIVGYGQKEGEEGNRAFLLIPVP